MEKPLYFRGVPVFLVTAACLVLLPIVLSEFASGEARPTETVGQAPQNLATTHGAPEISPGETQQDLNPSGEEQVGDSSQRKKRLSSTRSAVARVPRLRLFTGRSGAANKLFVALTLVAVGAFVSRRLANVIWRCLVKAGKLPRSGLSPRMLSAAQDSGEDAVSDDDICSRIADPDPFEYVGITVAPPRQTTSEDDDPFGDVGLDLRYRHRGSGDDSDPIPNVGSPTKHRRSPRGVADFDDLFGGQASEEPQQEGPGVEDLDLFADSDVEPEDDDDPDPFRNIAIIEGSHQRGHTRLLLTLVALAVIIFAMRVPQPPPETEKVMVLGEGDSSDGSPLLLRPGHERCEIYLSQETKQALKGEGIIGDVYSLFSVVATPPVATGSHPGWRYSRRGSQPQLYRQLRVGNAVYDLFVSSEIVQKLVNLPTGGQQEINGVLEALGRASVRAGRQN